jgi:hypothetical protein
MGEAKRRGAFDQRKIQAQQRKALEQSLQTDNAMAWRAWARSKGYTLKQLAVMWKKLGLTEIPPFEHDRPPDGEDAPGKGVQGLNCNLTACQLPGSAHWQHADNRHFYCMSCAWDINEFAIRVDGVDLFPALTAELNRLGMGYTTP